MKFYGFQIRNEVRFFSNFSKAASTFDNFIQEQVCSSLTLNKKPFELKLTENITPESPKNTLFFSQSPFSGKNQVCVREVKLTSFPGCKFREQLEFFFIFEVETE